MTSLPPIPGPKLGRFPLKKTAKISFLGKLGRGEDATGYKVRLTGNVFVLKVYEFDSGGYANGPIFLPEGIPWTKLDNLYYFHPFYNECRAYGRLAEVRREDLSVRCHGYILLSPQQEKQLQEYTGQPFERPGGYKDMPIFALVKSYIKTETKFLPHMIPKMMRNVHAYHKNGIWISDIHENNYFNGILFDLSRAKTAPHPDLRPASVEQAFSMSLITDTPADDYQAFDVMIDDWNSAHPRQLIWSRFQPNLDYTERLRGFDISDRKELTKRIRSRDRVVYHRPELSKWQKSFKFSEKDEERLL